MLTEDKNKTIDDWQTDEFGLDLKQIYNGQTDWS